jgi:hypothetical protein
MWTTFLTRGDSALITPSLAGWLEKHRPHSWPTGFRSRLNAVPGGSNTAEIFQIYFWGIYPVSLHSGSVAWFLSMPKPVSEKTSIAKATASSVCNHCGGSGQLRVASWAYKTCMTCVGTGVIKLPQAS